MAKKKIKMDRRRVLRGTHTYKGVTYFANKGDVVPFEDFELECPSAFWDQFSGPVSRRTKPPGSTKKKSKKGSESDLSTDKYVVEPAKDKRYYYNVFFRETGELITDKPIHKKSGVREFIAEDEKTRL